MAISALPESLHSGYEIHEWRHASAILALDFPDELADICDVLGRFRLCKTFLTSPGGQKSQVSRWIDSAFYRKGWAVALSNYGDQRDYGDACSKACGS